MRSLHLALVLLAARSTLSAQDAERDPLLLYPGNYRILVENEHVRVLDFRLPKGASEETHEHPGHVAVFLTDVKIQFTLPDGSTRLREAKAGEVGYSEPTAHASLNVGPNDAHGILIELKSPLGPPGSSLASGLVAPIPIDASLPKPSSSPHQITAVTLIHGLPGNHDDLRAHLLSLSAPTRAEAGCRQYDLYQSSVNLHEFMRLEVWESPAHLEAHKGTPHLRSSFAKRQREGWTTEILVFQRVE